MNQTFLYEGKAKIIFKANSIENVILNFKDSLTAGDGTKKGSFEGKGRINASVTASLFNILNDYEIDTHFVEKLSDTELLCRQVKIIPVEIVVRNVVAGSFSKRYGIEEGIPLKVPLVELFLKEDKLHDPLITDEGAINLGFLSRLELSYIKTIALQVNQILKHLFNSLNLLLIDFKLEFGRDSNGKINLADEITQDTMRLWDTDSKEKKDKDRFRRDLGQVKETYEAMLQQINDINQLDKIAIKTKAIVSITQKQGIIDAVGETTLSSLKKLGFILVEKVHADKNFTLIINSPLNGKIMNDLTSMINKLLSNPLIETTEIKFEY